MLQVMALQGPPFCGPLVVSLSTSIPVPSPPLVSLRQPLELLPCWGSRVVILMRLVPCPDRSEAQDCAVRAGAYAIFSVF